MTRNLLNILIWPAALVIGVTLVLLIAYEIHKRFRLDIDLGWYGIGIMTILSAILSLFL